MHLILDHKTCLLTVFFLFQDDYMRWSEVFGEKEARIISFCQVNATLKFMYHAFVL